MTASTEREGPCGWGDWGWAGWGDGLASAVFPYPSVKRAVSPARAKRAVIQQIILPGQRSGKNA